MDKVNSGVWASLPMYGPGSTLVIGAEDVKIKVRSRDLTINLLQYNTKLNDTEVPSLQYNWASTQNMLTTRLHWL